MLVAAFSIALGGAYFGVFGESVRTIDNCSTPARHYYFAPRIFTNRFSYGDYRDPEYDPSVPLMICLCHNNDKAGYEKLIGETTTYQIFQDVCNSPAPAPYYLRPQQP